MATASELFNQAMAYYRNGAEEQSAALCRQVLRAEPAHGPAHFILGIVAHKGGDHAAAATLLRGAVALSPADAGSHFHLGLVLKDQGKMAEAVSCFRQAVRLNPQFIAGLNNLALALKEQGESAEAAQALRQLLSLDPGHVIASYNLGNILMDEGRLAEAEGCFRAALRGNPQLVAAHNNLGNVLTCQGQHAEAAACYDEALRLKPGHAPTLRNRGHWRLLQGDLPGAWADYEYRWQKPGFARRQFAQPIWERSSLAGKTILLHAEQGLGDTIQFVRYAALVKEHGGAVLLECPDELVRILQSCAGIDRVLTPGCPLPPFDVHTPLLSLPGILQTTLHTVPAALPYLRADANLTRSWQQELGGSELFKIGIVWQGNPLLAERGCMAADQRRSIPLAQFEILARVPGVRLFSLQKGHGTEQLRQSPNGIVDLGDRLGDFMDTAAVMMNLDLIISADTSPLHLAGALGRPVWAALPLAPCWRWLLEREDSPWYPTMRLFRQRQAGDWTPVFERMAKEVQAGRSISCI